MEKNIIYDYEDRDTIMTDLIHKLLNKLYSISYPHTDKTFDELCEEYEAKSKGAYKYPIDFFYLPQKISTTIVHDFLEKHGIAFHWKDNMEFLIDILFNRGGIKEVYGPTDWSKEPLRHCIDVPTLDKIIPKEYADKVQGYLKVMPIPISSAEGSIMGHCSRYLTMLLAVPGKESSMPIRK